MEDRLRQFWDFEDLAATEARFVALLEAEPPEGRAELLTQLARVDGLRGDFDAGEARIEEALALEPAGAGAQARIALERGRLRRSSGEPEVALPLFESAFAVAVEGGEDFIAADAAHMAALAAPDRESFVLWTQRGIELAEAQPAAAYWLGPLLNNLGWEYYEAGQSELALDAFRRALVARERDPGNPEAIALACYALGKVLRALDRAEEAIPLLEDAVAWADASDAPDGWFHEELAEEYASVGRDDDARTQARVALPLLEGADPAFRDDEVRKRRLCVLAGSA